MKRMMKTMGCTLALAIAAAPLSSAIAATGPIRPAPTRALQSVVVSDNAPEVLASADPSCPKKFKRTKKWDRATGDYEFGIGGWNWSIGSLVKLVLESDCDKTQIALEANMRTKLFSIATVQPLTAKLTAFTDKDDKNSVDLALYGLGFEIGKVNIAQSDTAITGSYSLNKMLPAGPSFGSYSGEESLGDVDLTYSLDYQLIGNLSGSLTYSVKKDGLSLTANADALVQGKVTASGSVYVDTITVWGETVDIDKSLTASGTATFLAYDGSLAASAKFEPTYVSPELVPMMAQSRTAGADKSPAAAAAVYMAQMPLSNAWKLTAGITHNLTDVLSGEFVAVFRLFDGEDTSDTSACITSKDVTILELPGLADGYEGEKTWSYSKTFLKTH